MKQCEAAGLSLGLLPWPPVTDSCYRLHGDLAGSGVERTSHQHLLEAYHAQSSYI